MSLFKGLKNSHRIPESLQQKKMEGKKHFEILLHKFIPTKTWPFWNKLHQKKNYQQITLNSCKSRKLVET